MTQTAVPAKQGAFAKTAALAPKQGGGLQHSNGGGIPYIGFANGKMNAWDEIKADIPTLKEADVFLHTDVEGYRKLDPLVFSVVDQTQMWVERNDGNEVVRVTTEKQDFKSSMKEEIQAAIIVYGPDFIMPAVASFRTAVAALGSVADTGINKASDDAKWGAGGNEHKLTLAIPAPNLRFTVTANTYMKAFANGRKGVAAKGKIKPLSGAQMASLASALNDQSFNDRLQSVRNIYTKRIEELRAKMTK